MRGTARESEECVCVLEFWVEGRRSGREEQPTGEEEMREGTRFVE